MKLLKAQETFALSGCVEFLEDSQAHGSEMEGAACSFGATVTPESTSLCLTIVFLLPTDGSLPSSLLFVQEFFISPLTHCLEVPWMPPSYLQIQNPQGWTDFQQEVVCTLPRSASCAVVHAGDTMPSLLKPEQ